MDTQRIADIANTKKLDNNAVPAGTLETEQNVQAEQRKSIGDAWWQNYGGPDNAGKVAMLPNGFKFNTIQETNRDMQFIEGKAVTHDEILANYGMGLEILGKTDSQTRATAEAAIFVFQKFGVIPYLKLFVDTPNNDYLPAFCSATIISPL